MHVQGCCHIKQLHTVYLSGMFSACPWEEIAEFCTLPRLRVMQIDASRVLFPKETGGAAIRALASALASSTLQRVEFFAAAKEDVMQVLLVSFAGLCDYGLCTAISLLQNAAERLADNMCCTGWVISSSLDSWLTVRKEAGRSFSG